MEYCPNCNTKLNIDEKASCKCFSCNHTFEPSKLINYNTNKNSKNNICIFLIGLFIIVIIVCIGIYIGSNKEYTIAEGKVALEKIKAIQSNFGVRDPKVDTSELDKIISKRYICIGSIIISIIGAIICFIILCSNDDKIINSTISFDNNSIKNRLQELESIYKNELITQEEYKNKKKELISKL